MEKYGFVYIWFDKKRKMYYIGSHWGFEDDGYICSSNRMRNAYRRRPDDFKRRIIQRTFSDYKTLLEHEEKWLQKAERKSNKYYNLNFKTWHWASDENTIFSKKEKMSKNHWSKNPKYQYLKEQFSKNYKNKKMPEATKQKISITLTGFQRNEKAKNNMKIAAKKRSLKFMPTRLGMKHSEETKRKISESLKNR